MIDVAIITLGVSAACTYSLLRRDRVLAAVSGMVTFGLALVVIGGWT
jgi:hypothetical protein